MAETPSLEHYIIDNPARKDIRLACFDVDGTLLSLDGNYSLRLKDSIKRIQSLGIKTAVASGRPYFATRFLWDELGLIDAGVYCTGAQIFEPKHQRLHQAHYLPEETVNQLVAYLRDVDVYYELYTDNAFYVERNIAPHVLDVHASHLRIAPEFKSFEGIDGGVVKLLIGADLDKDQDALTRIELAFPECIFAYAALPAYPQWLFASIIHKEASKESAFDYLLDYYKITNEQVISFGDAQSDMVFLSKAGIGVAMGNAKDDVKSVADLVTAPVWEEGVAKALDSLIDDEPAAVFTNKG